MGKYSLTNHALDRAVTRFGVEAHKAVEWINGVMKAAKYVHTQPDGKLLYDSEGTRIVVSSDGSRIITLFPEVKLDFLQDTLNREVRKMKRKHTANIRKTEREIAEQYMKLSEQMANYANARNPQTRDIVGGRVEATERNIESLKLRIERMGDELKARIKAIDVIRG